MQPLGSLLLGSTKTSSAKIGNSDDNVFDDVPKKCDTVKEHWCPNKIRQTQQ